MVSKQANTSDGVVTFPFTAVRIADQVQYKFILFTVMQRTGRRRRERKGGENKTGENKERKEIKGKGAERVEARKRRGMLKMEEQDIGWEAAVSIQNTLLGTATVKAVNCQRMGPITPPIQTKAF